MTSPPADPAGDAADVGLLNPVWAGTTGEALSDDRAVVEAMVDAEAALLHALADAGVVPDRARAAAETVTGLRVDPRRLALDAVSGGNPVIPLVELLREAVGEDAARWVHLGATSQDVLDTALMLVSARVCRATEQHLVTLAGMLATLADRTRSVPMVARTLTQQALPTTLGMRASGWLAGVHDAIRMIRTCLVLPVSLGGPVGTAAGYGEQGPVVLHAFADRLGQRTPVSSWHTRRTPVVGLGTALTVTGGACGKIASDVLVMAQNEVGEAREGGGGGSSAMAHKANPAGSVLVSAAARQLPALGSVLAGAMAAEQERPAGAWHAEWATLRGMLRLASGAAERTLALVEELRFDEDAMRRNLDRLLETLGEGEPWLRAHVQHVGGWVDRVLAQHDELCG